VFIKGTIEYDLFTASADCKHRLNFGAINIERSLCNVNIRFQKVIIDSFKDNRTIFVSSIRILLFFFIS